MLTLFMKLDKIYGIYTCTHLLRLYFSLGKYFYFLNFQILEIKIYTYLQGSAYVCVIFLSIEWLLRFTNCNKIFILIKYIIKVNICMH